MNRPRNSPKTKMNRLRHKSQPYPAPDDCVAFASRTRWAGMDEAFLFGYTNQHQLWLHKAGGGTAGAGIRDAPGKAAQRVKVCVLCVDGAGGAGVQITGVCGGDGQRRELGTNTRERCRRDGLGPRSNLRRYAPPSGIFTRATVYYREVIMIMLCCPRIITSEQQPRTQPCTRAKS